MSGRPVGYTPAMAKHEVTKDGTGGNTKKGQGGSRPGADVGKSSETGETKTTRKDK